MDVTSKFPANPCLADAKLFLFYQDLIKTQERIRKLVPGFKFNLGFSGKYFHRGTWEENEGDDTILGKQQCLHECHLLWSL